MLSASRSLSRSQPAGETLLPIDAAGELAMIVRQNLWKFGGSNDPQSFSGLAESSRAESIDQAQPVLNAIQGK
jgi:hypothetical protein